MFIRLLLTAVVSLSILVLPASGQTDTAAAPASAIEGGTPTYIKEETPEQRRQRVGEVDPGFDPHPETTFTRNGRQWRIMRFDRRWARYDGQPEGWVRPMAMVNFAFEIYQHNDLHVWVWMPPPGRTVEEEAALAEVAQPKTGLTDVQLNYLRQLREEFSELEPRPVAKTVRFEESSIGLPAGGSWRHTAALADMNGDGFVDIIAPPQRGMRSFFPTIFLGDGKGNWKAWDEVEWPSALDYGSVAAGDFNGDGRPDLAFGIHLVGVRVFLNQGDGRFTDASEGMSEHTFATRRIVTADVDGDGDLDILALYEGPGRGGLAIKGGRVRAYINDGKAGTWRFIDATSEENFVSGDWMAVGRFNNDRFPDFVTANNALHGVDILYRSTGPAKWKSVDSKEGTLVPYYSVYTAVTTGAFTRGRIDDAVVSYGRHWPDVPEDLVPPPALRQVVGVDRISFRGKEPVRTPLMRFQGVRAISGMATADFDGDGKLDILFTRFEPREAVLLLGDGKGGFRRAAIEGLELAGNPNYDITVGDVNGDGRPDLVVMYESTSDSTFGMQNGSVRVYLNRGTAPASGGNR